MRLQFITILLAAFFASATASAQEQEIALANEYYQNGEFEKAIELFEKLSRREANLEKIHQNYLESMLATGDFNQAEKYIKKLTRNYPTEARYYVDYGTLLQKQGKKEESSEYLDNFLASIKKENDQLRYTADLLMNASMFEKAEQAYLYGQKNVKDEFFQELAELYAEWGKQEKMVEQYMGMLEVNESDLEYVQNSLQDNLPKEEDFDRLERTLVMYVQKNPDKTAYNELLIWFYLHKNEFYKAFVQARAIDRRKKLEGYKVLEIGRMALNNNAWDDAIKIFQYLNDRYENKPVQTISRRLLIKAKEELVKNTYPVDIVQIRSLATDYQQIIDEYGVRRVTADAVRSMALLQAFYLNNKDTAVTILQTLIGSPGMQQEMVSQAKLDLGDIYLLKGEPWEASLLYSQVEKAEKDENLGHIAKLKNAKLSYYKGEFELARAHLDVLKLATSREIANDAMDLSLLIQDNLDLDTTAAAMTEFAAIDLLVFQSQFEKALEAYGQMLENYEKHSLSDEVLWEQAGILMRLGNFEQAIEKLEIILDQYSTDIMADDANYTIGIIYQENLQKPEMAMEYYKEQLIKFPGSIYNVDARKRFRQLRGDNIN